MAEKGFGVKEINLIGASGTPTIESPNNLNLNAVNVAISTNVSIGGTLTVSGNVSVGGTLTYEDVTNIDSVGIVTARAGVVVGDTSNTTFRVHRIQGASATNCGLALNSGGSLNLFTDSSGAGTSRISISAAGNIQFSTFGSTYFLLEDYVTHAGDTNTQYGFDAADSYVVKTGGSTRLTVNNSGANVVGALTVNGSAISIDPTATDVQVAYELINTSSSGNGWRINGNGIVNTTGNPDLYLIRGQKYRFINNSGGTHPFQIQSDSSTAYSTGVTNNNSNSGNIDFVPRNDAPARLYYNCTNHGGMLGNIYLRGAGGQQTNVGITTFGGTSHISLPSGNTAQRPTGAAGMIRYNSQLSKMEFHNGTDWVQFKDNFFSATGGTTSTFGAYTLHTFTSNGTFAVTGSGTIDILVVAGGGQGGLPNASDNYGGGGGAGGLVWYTSFEVSAGNYSIVVGDGGAQTSSGSGNRRGNDGSNSTAFGLTALGGGGGGGQGGTTAGRDGGSGGGGGYPSGFGSALQPSQSNSLGSGTLVHNLGNNGGPGNNSPNGGGGGGGAGGTGFSGGASVRGGAGFNASSLVGTAVGDSGWFAGGGGGSQQAGYTNFEGNNGGNGGGGDGDNYNSGNQTAGQANTGGGGGAGTSQGGGKGGGSGVVIIRVLSSLL